MNLGQASKEGYVVRSFFELTDVSAECPFDGSGLDLQFDSYYFADREPYRLHCGSIGYHARQLAATDVAELLDHPSYIRYDVSFEHGPASIANRDWEMMARTKRERKAEWLKMDRSCCP